jgi:hypothetical protein
LCLADFHRVIVNVTLKRQHAITLHTLSARKARIIDKLYSRCRSFSVKQPKVVDIRISLIVHSIPTYSQITVHPPHLQH